MMEKEKMGTTTKPETEKGKETKQSGGGANRPAGKGKARDATSINPKQETPITPESPDLHPA